MCPWHFLLIVVITIMFIYKEFFQNMKMSIMFLRIGFIKLLKVQSCKLYNSKCIIVSTQITNTEILVFIAVLLFKLLSHKVLFLNGEDNRNL